VGSRQRNFRCSGAGMIDARQGLEQSGKCGEKGLEN
jgi:hypothetical protein